MIKTARTKTTLAEINIIGSAESDPFLNLQKPKSLLCLPLISQKSLQAVLYLHSYAVEAFKQEEKEVLKVLSVQAAISLEKLSIYQELDRTNSALIDLNKKVEEQSKKLADEVSARTAELHEKIGELKLAKEASEKAKDEAESARLDALRSKDEAVRANHLKSTFLATMSHEIRTPFNAVSYLSNNCSFDKVLGTIALLLDSGLSATQADCSPFSPCSNFRCWYGLVATPSMLTQIDTIKTASTSLLRIINDILDFSKVLTLNYWRN